MATIGWSKTLGQKPGKDALTLTDHSVHFEVEYY